MESRETSSPDFIQDKPPPPEGLLLFLFFTCLFSTKSLFSFLLPASHCLDATLLLYLGCTAWRWMLTRASSVHVLSGFWEGGNSLSFSVVLLHAPLQYQTQEKLPLHSLPHSLPQRKAGFPETVQLWSPPRWSWKLEKKHSWLRILKFKTWCGRKVNESHHLYF